MTLTGKGYYIWIVKQCENGDKIIEKCSDGKELVTSICGDGLWISSDVECSAEQESCE